MNWGEGLVRRAILLAVIVVMVLNAFCISASSAHGLSEPCAACDGAPVVGSGVADGFFDYVRTAGGDAGLDWLKSRDGVADTPPLHKRELFEFVRPERMEPRVKPLSPSPGDWVVTGNETRVDEEMVLTGNLIIEPGGSLTFMNVTLYMNCRYDGEWSIVVSSTGTFNVLSGSVITAYDPEYEFLFYVYGSLIMRDSELHECGYDHDHPGLWIQSDEGVVIENSTISYNEWDGINCVRSSNITVSGCNISYNGHGIFCDYSSNITVSRCNISYNGDGINCWDSSSIAVLGCNISYNGHAIGYRYSSNITVSGCEVGYNEHGGIDCWGSSDVTVSGCKISDNWKGVLLYFSSNVTIIGNTFVNNGVDIWGELKHCIHDIRNNTVNGKPLMYILNATGYSVPPNAGEVIIVNSINVVVSGANLSNTDTSIEILYSNNTSIEDCVIKSNFIGIACDFSNGLNISGCDISNNDWEGILCYESSNIMIYKCVISYNAEFGGIYCYDSSNVSVHYCDIISNVGHGLYNSGPYLVNATHNWWGSPDGPEYKEEGDPYDPEEVYSEYGPEYLIYEPWLTESVIKDTIPPTIIIKYSPDGAFVAGEINITVEITDVGTGIVNETLYIDGSRVFQGGPGGPFYRVSFTYDWDTTDPYWSDGNYTIKVVAYDAAGNRAEQSVTVTVDNTAPVAEIIEPLAGALLRGTVDVVVSGEDANLELIELYVAGELMASWSEAGTHTYEWDTTTFTDGSYSIRLVVRDRAGNTVERTLDVTVDNTPPVVGSPALTPEKPRVGESVTVSVEVGDATAGVEKVLLWYRVSGGSWMSVEMMLEGGVWRAVIPGQAAGATVEYYVEAYDRAGNVAKSATASYTVSRGVPLGLIAGAIIAVAVIAVVLVALRRRT